MARGDAWEALEKAVRDRHDGMSILPGAGAVVRECLPVDVRDVIRRVKSEKRKKGRG